MAAEVCDVALFNAGETAYNTLVIGGVDLVIPLELDIDGDPFQDDAVCLRSHGGDFEQALTSADPAVTAAADKRHLYYPFLDVPAGLYHLDVLIAGQWTTVISTLLVSRGEAWVGPNRLPSRAPETAPARPDSPALESHSHSEDCGCTC